MINFKALRAKAGLTQSQMADALGMKQSAYSKLESGGWNASPETEARYLEYISDKFPNINFEDYKAPAGVSVNNNRSKLRDVKVSAIDDRAYEIIAQQSNQIAELIAAIKMQNELINSLTQKLSK